MKQHNKKTKTLCIIFGNEIGFSCANIHFNIDPFGHNFKTWTIFMDDDITDISRNFYFKELLKRTFEENEPICEVFYAAEAGISYRNFYPYLDFLLSLKYFCDDKNIFCDRILLDIDKYMGDEKGYMEDKIKYYKDRGHNIKSRNEADAISLLLFLGSES